MLPSNAGGYGPTAGKELPLVYLRHFSEDIKDEYWMHNQVFLKVCWYVRGRTCNNFYYPTLPIL